MVTAHWNSRRLRRIVGITLTLCSISPAVGDEDQQKQQPRLVTQTGHTGSNVVAVFSPDGRFVLTGAWDKTARLWHAATAREILRFTGHEGFVTAVAFSPEGRWVLTGSADRSARLWDAATGKELRKFVGHRAAIQSVVFSPDGRNVLTGSADQTSRIWDAQRGGELLRLQGNHAGGRSAFSPDGKFVVTGGVFGNTACLWEVASGLPTRLYLGHTDDIYSVAFSPDGQHVLTGSEDKTARLWKTDTGREVRKLEGHAGDVWSASFSHDGRLLATGSSQRAHVWNAETGEELRTIQAMPGRFVGAVQTRFSPDGRLLLTGAGDLARLWDVNTGEEVRRFHGLANAISSVTYANDGQHVLTAGFDARIWDTVKGKVVREFYGDLMPITSAAISPDGRFVLTGGSWDPYRSAGIWNVETQRVIHRLSGHDLPVRCAVFSHSGRLALTSGGTAARLWDAASGREIRQFKGHRFWISSLAFSPDDRFVLTGSEGPVIVGDQGATVRIWETETGREVHQFEVPIGISCVAYSPDGRYVAAGSSGHPVHGWKSHVVVWDAASGKETRRFALAETISSLAFSPDGRSIAAGSSDNVARMWDLATGQETLRLEGHTGNVTSIELSPDGRRLLTASDDGTTRFWNADNGQPVCRLVSFLDGAWVVVNEQGRFDASDPDLIPGLHWIMPDDPQQPLPVEIFMRDYYEPKLLAKLMSDEALAPIRDIRELNRVQPEVEIAKVETHVATGELVSVTVSVAATTREYGGVVRTSGMRDLHLFRDGQLVGYQALAEDNERTTTTFENIKLPRTGVGQVQFTAYAFNADRVKSETTPPVVHRFDLPRRAGRVYIVSVGVDNFDGHQPTTFRNLRYAAHDAKVFAATLGDAYRGSDQFDEVTPIILTSEHSADRDRRTASKQQIKAVFDLLAGRNVDEKIKSSVANADRIEPARPEDMVLISFSTHGYTRGRGAREERLGGREDEFYLVPSDIGDPQEGRILDRCISAEQLSLWLRDVDAGEMVMIIDACQSAGAQGEGFKPGPLGSRGLGQLAYNKRMRILAASQVAQPAQEFGGAIRHGLLSYVLLKQGLEKNAADLEPRDSRITLGEWLRFGERQVPLVAEQIQRGELRLATLKDATLDDEPAADQDKQAVSEFQQPVLFDFTKDRDDTVIKEVVR